MKTPATVLFTLLFLFTSPTTVHAKAGIEWETLNDEVMSLYRAGHYERAVAVARKALAVAEKNAGPDHPSMATPLTNLAAMYRFTNRHGEAEKLEQRATRIQAIRR